MRELTVEELKALQVGDWVWIVVLKGDTVNKEHNGKYYHIQQPLDELADKEFWCGWQGYGTAFEYADYGDKWVAYKNKEQTERSIPDVNKKCCNNCRLKGFGENKCDKLNGLFEQNGLKYEQDISLSSLDRWHKRHELMCDYCCDDFDNKWLEYPIAVADTETQQPIYNKGLVHSVGQLVKVRPCGKEYKDKTYLGFYLGDLPISIGQSFNRETHILKITTHSNPAIFIPQVGKIIFGCESWWGEIKSPDDLNDITDECINSQWYVKALKELDKKD